MFQQRVEQSLERSLQVAGGAQDDREIDASSDSRRKPDSARCSEVVKRRLNARPDRFSDYFDQHLSGPFSAI
jgi:hypothetical protein